MYLIDAIVKALKVLKRLLSLILFCQEPGSEQMLLPFFCFIIYRCDESKVKPFDNE